MKKLALLIVVFLLHVEASDDTQVGTFDAGVSSEKPKIGKKYKAPIKEAKTYQVDINESEVEGISVEPSKPQMQKEKEFVITKEEPIKIQKPESVKSDVSQSEGGGVVLPFDEVDKKSGVVLPMDKKEKNGFFSIFGF